MTLNPNNYFDVWGPMQELIGETDLIVTVTIVIVAYMSLKADLDMGPTILLILLWASILFAQTFLVGLWIFVVTSTGLIFYYNYAQKHNR